VDEVFRALADPSRRRLLDRLDARNGQSLRELCAGLDMARQSVSKHLAVLEAASVVTTIRRGREKLHYLNAEPINAIADRWLAPAVRRRDPARAPTMARQVAVCGPGDCTDEEAAHARRIGELLAQRGAVVLCGGGTGVMAAGAAGTLAAGGTVVGIQPGTGPASVDLSVTISTDLGEARNAVLVNSADAVIVVGGSWGTLSEVALAMRRGRIPVISLGGWRVVAADGVPVPGVERVLTPEEAVAAATRV
jgi:uncharacterized protein (TIGR00725 family)